jgi:hypothetical protein
MSAGTFAAFSKIHLNTSNSWEVVLVGATYRVFRSTLQGLNQSIVALSPLSEATYFTSHEIPNDGN